MKRLTPSELKEKINFLKKEKNAVILAHNYQLGEIQDIADFVGDSLELSFKAAESSADIIIFCGVTFMAETAALLSPDSKVLLPNMEAGCPMADMAETPDVSAMKEKYPDALVVTYVNSSAAVKALTDICVTSANALKIVASLPKDKEILFLPDKNLGAYIQRETGKKMILWDGFCPTHMRIGSEDILRRKKEDPTAVVMVHPEAPLDVIDLADAVLSTGGMLRYAKETDAEKIIVATEVGIIHRLSKENPDKQFIPVSEQAICPTMKQTRLEDLLESLHKEQYEIKIPEEIAEKAKASIIKMLEASV
ncbi:MAG: quinolinate synthase NadA [Verrucomicrobiota bacterium]|nr:quinolinate synthase NadA [Verrucomicrobiota bacterium]